MTSVTPPLPVLIPHYRPQKPAVWWRCFWPMHYFHPVWTLWHTHEQYPKACRGHVRHVFTITRGSIKICVKWLLSRLLQSDSKTTKGKGEKNDSCGSKEKKKDILLNHKAERGLKGSLVNPSYPPFPPSKSLARKSVSRVVSTYPQNPLTGTIHLYSCEHSHTLCLPLDIKISSFLPPPFSRLSAHPTSVPTTSSLMSQATPPPACYLPHSLLPFNTSIRMKLQTACSVPIHSFQRLPWRKGTDKMKKALLITFISAEPTITTIMLSLSFALFHFPQ